MGTTESTIEYEHNERYKELQATYYHLQDELLGVQEQLKVSTRDAELYQDLHKQGEEDAKLLQKQVDTLEQRNHVLAEYNKNLQAELNILEDRLAKVTEENEDLQIHIASLNEDLADKFAIINELRNNTVVT